MTPLGQGRSEKVASSALDLAGRPAAASPAPGSTAGSASSTERPRAGRTLLGGLLARGLSALAERADRTTDRIGRLTLYGGALLIALTDLRLPGGVGGAADVLLFVSLLCAWYLALRGQVLNIGVFKVHMIGVALFVIGIVISATQYRQDSAASLLNLGKFIFTTTLLLFTCIVLLKRRRQVTVVLGCWVVSAAATSLIAVLQAWLGTGLLGIDKFWGTRMGGLSTNPNHLGAIAGLGMVGAMSLAARVERLARLPWLVALVLCAAGVIVSASRTGAVVAVGSLAVWLGLHFRLKREFTVLLAGVCLIAVGVAGYLFVTVGGGQSLTSRVSKAMDPTSDAAVQERLYQYQFVLDEALANPIVGVGLAEDDAQVYGQTIHNMFLRVFYGGGLISLVGIVVILGDLLYKSFMNFVNTATYESKVIALCLFTGIVGLVLAGMTEPVLYQRQVWMPAALALALHVLQQQRRRAASLRPRPRHALRSAEGRRSGREHRAASP